MKPATLRHFICPFLFPPSCRVFSTSTTFRRTRRGFEQQQPKSDYAKGDHLELTPDVSNTDAAKLPHDVGLLEGTFIMPTGGQKPAFIKRPLRRLRLEWHRLRTRCIDLYSVLWYYKFNVTRPRPRLALWSIVPSAIARYKDMYMFLASSDPKTTSSGTTRDPDAEFIEKACCEGLASSFKKHIAVRPQSQNIRWEIKRIWPRLTTRVVSHRASPYPREASALRQVVVKIKSKQRLLRTNNVDNSIEAESDKWARVCEYVVLQRRIIDGEEGDWKIWGTTEETSYENVFGQEAGNNSIVTA